MKADFKIIAIIVLWTAYLLINWPFHHFIKSKFPLLCGLSHAVYIVLWSKHMIIAKKTEARKYICMFFEDWHLGWEMQTMWTGIRTHWRELWRRQRLMVYLKGWPTKPSLHHLKFRLRFTLYKLRYLFISYGLLDSNLFGGCFAE